MLTDILISVEASSLIPVRWVFFDFWNMFTFVWIDSSIFLSVEIEKKNWVIEVTRLYWISNNLKWYRDSVNGYRRGKGIQRTEFKYLGSYLRSLLCKLSWERRRSIFSLLSGGLHRLVDWPLYLEQATNLREIKL